MRIVVATHYWRPHRGGIETVAFEQARRLVARGHQVSVVTSRLNGDPAVHREDGVDVHRVHALNPLERRGIPYPLFSHGLPLKLLKLLAHHDVVLGHSHAFMPSVEGALAARLLGRPFVLLQHHSFVVYKRPWSWIEQMADSTLGRLTITLAAKRVAVSSESARYVERIGGREVSILHNGVDVERFVPRGTAPDAGATRARLKLPGAPWVLTLRRLVFKNGLDTLLLAASALQEKGIHVVIAGGGPDRELLERQIRELKLNNVHLLGFISDEELPALYRAADLFVLPSKSGEGFPMVILEAFASGLPVVATRSGGQVDVVREDENGWLVPADSPAELSRAILRALTNEPQRAAAGLRARQLALELSWERQVDALEQILEEVRP